MATPTIKQVTRTLYVSPDLDRRRRTEAGIDFVFSVMGVETARVTKLDGTVETWTFGTFGHRVNQEATR